MQNDKRKALSLFFAFAGYAIFGFSFLFSKQALAVATPFMLLAVRFSVAFAVLNCLLFTKKFTLSLKGKNIKPLLLLGTLQPILYFISESFGVRLVATSFVGIILALIPVVSVLFGVVFLKERVRVLQVVCIFLSVGGVFLTTQGQAAGGFSLLGFILLLVAVCASSAFNVLSKKTSAQFTAFERTYVMFALGCTTFVTIALVQSIGNVHEMIVVPLTSGSFWLSVGFLAVMSSVGAFLMLNYAMGHLSVAEASVFGNVTTIISIIAGVIVLKEPFGHYQIAGAIVIIASVYFVNRPSRTRSA